MKNDEMKDILSSIFEGLINSEEHETKEKFGEEIEKLIGSKHGLKNPENYDTFLNYQLKIVLKEVVSGLNSEVTDRNKISKLFFIYQNYNFLSRNLLNSIIHKEGRACSVDKSRWLIQMYIDYVIDGTLPDMTIEDKCFWKPHFGTGEQWINFCNGLMDLYYGDPTKYLHALMSLKS